MTNDFPVDPEKINLYQGLDNIPSDIWKDLESLEPGRISLTAGVRHAPGRGFIVPFLGVDHVVRPSARTITVPSGAHCPGFQAGLVLLNYLIHATEAGLSGRMVAARELDGGELFFTGPHALSTAPVVERYRRDAAGFLTAASTLGAMPLAAGDAAFRLLALPKVLLAYTLYEEDDEFPARLTITFDAHTDRHLPLDCVWALVNVISNRLGRGA